jgi:Ran GTPase-activating protein (RanGAP) involved in mRNA processing and transport
MATDCGCAGLVQRFSDRLADKAVYPVVEALRGNPAVVEVDLGFNAIADAGATALGRLLTAEGGAVEALNLEGNAIGLAGAEALAAALAKCGTLRQLVLRGNPLGDKAGVALLNAINDSPVELLDLQGCDLGIDSFVSTSVALASRDAKVSHLYIGRAKLPAYEAQKSVVLSRMLTLNTSLVCLDVSRCNMADDDAENIARALRSNTTLRSLSLASNKLTWVSGVHMGKYLLDNKSLEELDLSHNSIEDPGCLGGGGVGDGGLTQVLRQNAALRYLSLAHCGIGDVGLCALAAGLEGNGTLGTLLLWGNVFGQPSGKLFLQVPHTYSPPPERRGHPTRLTILAPGAGGAGAAGA